MASKALQAHEAAIRAGEVTKTNVIGLRKAINLAERGFAGWSVPKSAPDRDDVWQLENLLERDPPRVAGELHETGLALLRNKRFRKRLEAVSDIIEWPSHFELVRFDRIGRRDEYAVPVYRLTGQNGGTFTFRNIPWQSGGNGPELLSIAGRQV